MNAGEAENFRYNPFDLTKVWPHGEFPLIDVGVMTLNRNPMNYFAEIEQSAFSPVNIVPGMGYSPDKMLQARLISYPDAHRHRMGVNYESLPVNKPKCPVHTYHRDGHMRFDDNGGASPNYEPNSFGGPTQDPRYMEEAWTLDDARVGRFNHREGNDDYTQAGNLFRLMTAEQKGRLIHNLVNAMASVPKRIQVKQIGHFLKADRAYGEGVAKGLGVDLSEVEANEMAAAK